jgi:hypothetical protein
LAIVPDAAGAGTLGNRLTNPSAEDPAGLIGWQGSGWTSAAYGSAARYPASAPCCDAGSRLFSADQSGAQISQLLDLSDVAPAIDAGSRPLSIGGKFGGQAGRSDTARLVVSMLDRSGAQLGAPLIVGSPSDSDRRGTTKLIFCQSAVIPPPGTRAARVVLEAVGPPGMSTAFAEELYATTAFDSFPPGPVGAPADGAGCFVPLAPQDPDPIQGGSSPSSPAQAMPRLTSLVVLPTASRCGKSSKLRFRVRPEWRSKVVNVTVAARGRTDTHDPRTSWRPLTVRGPRRASLLVTITAQMTDGRRPRAQRRFRPCRTN